MNINRIITESINKVIAENTNIQALFQQLNTSYNNLMYIRQQIKMTNLKATNDQQIVNFVGHRLYNFVGALEQALKRCIYAKNINEAYYGSGWFGRQVSAVPHFFQDVGFKVPQEFSDAWNTGVNQYYNAKNFLFNRDSQSQNQNTNTNSQELTGNEKLIYLLDTIWPKIQKEYLTLDGQVNLNRKCPIAVKAKNEIEAIYQTVKLIRNNAQTNTNNTNTNNRNVNNTNANNRNVNNTNNTNTNAQGVNP